MAVSRLVVTSIKTNKVYCVYCNHATFDGGHQLTSIKISLKSGRMNLYYYGKMEKKKERKTTLHLSCMHNYYTEIYIQNMYNNSLLYCPCLFLHFSRVHSNL